MSRGMLGADLVWSTLESLGVRHTFGLPGTQTIALYDALRRSSIRSILTTNETAAAFAAGGYFRASGRVAALITIPGPGFTYALTGLAEARLDSAGLVHLTMAPAEHPGRRFQHQRIEQAAIAAPLVKAVIDIETPGQIADRLAEAVSRATGGEPGPVLVQLSHAAVTGRVDEGVAGSIQPPVPSRELLDELARRLRAARRPIIMVGQGAAGAADALRRVVERLRIPVVASSSGRGVIPEDHPLVLPYDRARANRSALEQFCAAADVVLVLGCKLSHNATDGFALRLAANRLVHVDPSQEVLGANYPADLTVCATAEQVLAHVEGVRDLAPTDWSDAELGAWRARLWPELSADELVIKRTSARAPSRLLRALQAVVPSNAIVVTDSGLHQVLARRHLRVRSPRGLICPSDFQSMGYGIPAAIGAQIAAPERRVIAIIGDGGLLMSGLEIATAVREGLPIVVVVFNDRSLNLIRQQQFRETGWSHDSDVAGIEIDGFARALGAAYIALEGDADEAWRAAFAHRGPVVVEVFLGDGWQSRRRRVERLAKESAKRVVGRRLLDLLKRWRGRR